MTPLELLAGIGRYFRRRNPKNAASRFTLGRPRIVTDVSEMLRNPGRGALRMSALYTPLGVIGPYRRFALKPGSGPDNKPTSDQTRPWLDDILEEEE